MGIPLAERLQNDKLFQKRYAEWASNPVTREMIQAISEGFSPPGLPMKNFTGDMALYYSGTVDAATSIFRALLDLPGFLNELRTGRTADAYIRAGADYGARKRVTRKGDVIDDD